MRFLLDNNLPPSLEGLLVEAGHDTAHIGRYGLQAAPDELVLDRARSENRVLISADTDFGGLMATRRAASPSVSC